MNKKFVRLISVLCTLALVIFSALTIFASGSVSYVGGAEKYIFAPGSEYSPNDIFPDFKNLMPGDSARQDITVRNDASNGVKVKIYVRSLGAHEDSVEFLSKLHMTVAKSENNTMEYMFNAAADQVDGMGDWVYLGTLYSGGEVNLVVTVDIPIELDDRYQDAAGYIDWEFKVEELPIEPGDPTAPQTGDNSSIYIYVMIASVIALLIILILPRKKKKNDKRK